MQKKRKTPRTPFIVTLTTAASVASVAGLMALPSCKPVVDTGGSTGCPDNPPQSAADCSDDGQVCTYDYCGSTIDYRCEGGSWEHDPIASCNPPPPPACSDEVPASGSSCNVPGVVCTYTSTDPACPSDLTATCGDDLTWSITSDATCNPPPPPPLCPEELPNQGEPCDGSEPVCTYPVDTPCGPMDVQAACEDGVWRVPVVQSPTCNPPPPDLCYTLATEGECAALGSFCRWLVPGCADPASGPAQLSQAGCFPSFDCAVSEQCPVGTSCQEAIYNPCYNLACDACGAVAKLCTAP